MPWWLLAMKDQLRICLASGLSVSSVGVEAPTCSSSPKPTAITVYVLAKPPRPEVLCVDIGTSNWIIFVLFTSNWINNKLHSFGFSIKLITIFQIGIHITGISKMHIPFINGTTTNTTSLPLLFKNLPLFSTNTHIKSLYPMSSGLQLTINIQTNNYWQELWSIIPSRNLYRLSLFLQY